MLRLQFTAYLKEKTTHEGRGLSPRQPVNPETAKMIKIELV